MNRGNITLSEIQSMIRMLNDGESPANVACIFDRHEEAMGDAINAYRLGVSRLAKKAKALGAWEVTRGTA